MHQPNVKYSAAPEIQASHWLNVQHPVSLQELKGFVVVIHAFQMLCPACATHGIPQASTIHTLYENDPVKVIGLHTVFEHHQVMNLEALKTFVFEYQLNFPIAVDQPAANSPILLTMQAYQMQGISYINID